MNTVSHSLESRSNIDEKSLALKIGSNNKTDMC